MIVPTAPTGSNAERSRHRNRQAVLGQIYRAGTMGRAEIARSLSLSTQAVSNIIADLESDGLLIEKGRLSAGRGLPAVQYAVNPEGGYALGIEIRPDAVLAALLNLQGHPVMTQRIALPHADPQSVFSEVVSVREAAMGVSPKVNGRFLGAGVVMPGPFGATGIAGLGTDLPGWEHIETQSFFQDALGMAIEVGNDANAAAMAERLTGVAKGLTNYAYLYFGAGLGLGLISGGQLVRGAFGNAGEIGHIPLPSGGTLESKLSRLSVQRRLRDRGKPADDIASLEALFAEGDPDLMAWLAPASDALAHAVGIVENLFDPQCVILGGAMPDAILDYLVAQSRLPDLSVSHRPESAHERLRRGASGRMAATLGAAALVLNRTLTPYLVPAH